MKKIYLLLALFMGVCAFSACSDDDKEDAKTNELVGTWDATREWWEDTDGNITDEAVPGTWKDVYVFEDNGTGTNFFTDEYNKTNETAFTYTYENHILTFVYEDEEEGTSRTTLNVTIKDDVAMVKTTEVDDAGEYYCIELKKIK